MAHLPLRCLDVGHRQVPRYVVGIHLLRSRAKIPRCPVRTLLLRARTLARGRDKRRNETHACSCRYPLLPRVEGLCSGQF